MSERNTTQRDRDRKTIARTKPPCAICQHPIDYTLKTPDPMSFEVDHTVPLHKGGPDTLANKQPAHRSCNRAKWHHTTDDLAPRTFVTHRTW